MRHCRNKFFHKQGDPKNRNHKIFWISYKDPVNFNHFAGFKLQSAYYHFPKFQSLKSLRIKVMFFSKYVPNGLHGVGGHCLIFAGLTNVSFRPSTHCPTRISIHQTFGIKILHSPRLPTLLKPVKNYAFWWSMTTLKLSPKTCLHYFLWIVSEIGLHANAFSLVDKDVVGKSIVAIFHALSPLLQPEK